MDIYRFPKLNYEEIIIVFLTIITDFCLVACGFAIIKTTCQNDESPISEPQESEERADSPENILTAKTTAKAPGKMLDQ